MNEYTVNAFDDFRKCGLMVLLTQRIVDFHIQNFWKKQLGEKAWIFLKGTMMLLLSNSTSQEKYLAGYKFEHFSWDQFSASEVTFFNETTSVRKPCLQKKGISFQKQKSPKSNGLHLLNGVSDRPPRWHVLAFKFRATTGGWTTFCGCRAVNKEWYWRDFFERWFRGLEFEAKGWVLDNWVSV